MIRHLALLGFAAALVTFPTGADEGMWLYEAPPRALLRDRHGFELTDAWLEHLRLSSVRFNSGGSGSFISADGLVISNHHVGADALQKLSTPERNLLADGFLARRRSEEIPCVDLELNVLESVEDVTARVNGGVPADADADEAFRARRRVIAAIEKESLEQTGLRSDVVTLFQGGAYHLYRYHRYTDVRLVFAPEQQAAFFGGDPDNFEFPRYDYDVCFFRVYEDGKPVHRDHFLRWSDAGAAEGELVFVSGHPGRTSRLLTVAELEFLRDWSFPYALARYKRLETLLSAWSARSVENARRARDELFGIQNARKARDGGHAGLYDPDLMGRKAAAETAFRRRLEADGSHPGALAAYDRIAEAQAAIHRVALRHRLLEGAHGFAGESFQVARLLLRSAEERGRPDGERLPEFSDAARASTELRLFSGQPIHEDLEILLLSDSLTFLAEHLGVGDPLVAAVLDGRSPRDRAVDLIRTTRVRDVAVRREWYAGGAPALREARDPMVELARLIDTESRTLREQVEAREEVKHQAQAEISRARFQLEGASSYPDATFSLRLAFGTVGGYAEDGHDIPAFTRVDGLFARSTDMGGQPPFDLPPSWVRRKRALDGRIPFNFVSTADIIGGNSGSPVVNRDGRFVGIIFDGNLASLVLDFAYDDVRARAISVDSRLILAGLDRVYGARELVREIRAGQSR